MLLGVELLDRFHPNTSPWDRKVVAFAWEMVEVMMSPTVLVKVDWWTFQEWKIVVEEEASSALLGLNPDASEVLAETSENKPRGFQSPPWTHLN